MSGTVDLLERCFAGIELRGDILRLDPFWPRRLGTLQFSIFYRDHAITLSVGAGTVRATSAPGKVAPVHVACHGEARELHPGHTVEFCFRNSS